MGLNTRFEANMMESHTWAFRIEFTRHMKLQFAS